MPADRPNQWRQSFQERTKPVRAAAPPGSPGYVGLRLERHDRRPPHFNEAIRGTRSDYGRAGQRPRTEKVRGIAR